MPTPDWYVDVNIDEQEDYGDNNKYQAPAPTDGTKTTLPRTTNSPTQLELELITIGGQPTTHNTPCEVALGTATHPRIIPGLDASLCRCATCTSRAIGGIWWFDSWMRDAVLKRRVPFKFKVTDGETLRDNE